MAPAHVLLSIRYFDGYAAHSASAHWTTNNSFSEEEITQTLKNRLTYLFVIVSILFVIKLTYQMRITNYLRAPFNYIEDVEDQPQGDY